MFFFFQLKLIYLIFSSKYILSKMHKNQKIIALDLKNACINNMENWFLATDYITSSITIDFIRYKVKEREEVDDPLTLF